jgi:hypothetical protein
MVLHTDSWQEGDTTIHYKSVPHPTSKLLHTSKCTKKEHIHDLHFQLCKPLALFNHKFYTTNYQITITHTTSTTASDSSIQSQQVFLNHHTKCHTFLLDFSLYLHFWHVVFHWPLQWHHPPPKKNPETVDK